VSLVGTGRWPSRGRCCGPDFRIRSTANLTSRGQRFRRHHAAAHADRGENHDPTRANHHQNAISTEGLTCELAIREQCPPHPRTRATTCAGLRPPAAGSYAALSRRAEQGRSGKDSFLATKITCWQERHRVGSRPGRARRPLLDTGLCPPRARALLPRLLAVEAGWRLLRY